jgi:hypothetical protein
MNRQFLGALLAGLLISLSGSVFAQTTPDTTTSDANATHNITISEGTTARISLQSQLSSKISEVGDEVIGVLYESIRSSDGRVAIPRGTEFIGRVTQVQAAKRPQREATITITFEQMRMSYGVEKVSTIVTAIDDYANDEKYKSKDDEGKVGAGRSGSRTGRNAGTMGGIGGAIGGAIGGLGGVLGGAGVGALGGVLMSKGNDIKLAAGTVLRVRFERPVNLPALEPTR